VNAFDLNLGSPGKCATFILTLNATLFPVSLSLQNKRVHVDVIASTASSNFLSSSREAQGTLCVVSHPSSQASASLFAQCCFDERSLCQALMNIIFNQCIGSLSCISTAQMLQSSNSHRTSCASTSKTLISNQSRRVLYGLAAYV
jgi:hypothetical protein